MMEKAKRIPFSFEYDGPLVERMYKEGKSVSAIAKELHRGYATIKNYLDHKQIYNGPMSCIQGKRGAILAGEVPDEHIKKQIYFSIRHQMFMKFSGYWTDADGNKVCRVYVSNIDNRFSAYCKPEELITKT